jgi:hypothetical protein
LPYVYIGQYVEGARHLAILLRGDRMLTVATGDIVDNIYRVDDVEGGVLKLTYLPLKAQQSMNIGVVK